MNKVLIIAIMTAAATAATSKDFVNENFEGAFPPPGWKTVSYAEGEWMKFPQGPWGCYAWGHAYSSEYGLCRATLTSPEFNVKAKNKYYYRFDYSHSQVGYGTGGAEFYIKFVEPRVGTFLNVQLPETEWTERRGVFYATVDARVKACWRVWTECYWRGHSAWVYFDRAIISDEKRFPAVAPTSLGRVKALFR
jgi:hypothetical protein